MQIVQNGAAVVCAAAISYAVLCPAKAQALGDLPSPTAASEYTVMPPRDFSDVKLATAGLVGGQSAIAVNPKNASVFVATYANQGACWVRVSTNAGRTWAAAKKLPMSGKPNCDTPAVTWAPDGSRVYAAYSYRITYKDKWGQLWTKETGALLSSSTDAGATWSAPRMAAKYTSEYDVLLGLKLATPLSASDSRWLYLLINGFADDDDWFVFTRSGDRGQTWATPTFLAATNNWTGVTTPSMAGGLGGEVLVTWGYSTCPDFICPPDEIQVNRSSNYGASFRWNFSNYHERIVAVPGAYGYTSVAFGAGGVAHIVYTADSWQSSPGADPGTYYVFSNKAPYTTWSAPIALHDNMSADNFYSPALTVSACGSGTSVLHAGWLDDRASPGKFNVFYTRKVARTGELWSTTLRVSGTSPLYFDYPVFSPSLAAGLGTAIGVWGQDWEFNEPRPVWSSRIDSGVSCP